MGQNSLQDQYTKTSDDQPFYFQVSASFGGVEGHRSNEIVVNVSALQAPPAPVLTAALQQHRPDCAATIVLSADPPQDTQYLPGTIYYYYRSTNPGGEGAHSL